MFDDFVQTSKPRRSQLGAASHDNSFSYDYDRSGLSGVSDGNGLNGDAGAHANGGFEPPSAAAADPISAVETGFISTDAQGSSETPIFQLGRVQYAFPAPLALLTVQSNIMTMCMYAYPRIPSPPPTVAPRIVRINLDDPERTEEAEVPIPPIPRNKGQPQVLDPSAIGPHRMYADPSGKHLLLSMRSGDNYYWTSGWRRARPLSKLKGMVIESVAWNRFSSSSGGVNGRGQAAGTITTNEILLGTRTGEIWETIITAPASLDSEEGDFLDRLARRTAGAAKGLADVDKSLRHVFTLPERQAITGLHAEPFGHGSARKAVVIATTSTRIYEFVGSIGGRSAEGSSDSSSAYENVFGPYRSGQASVNLKSELPGEMLYSELHFWAPGYRKTPKTLAWLTGPGVYHGLLNFADQQPGDSVIDSANLLPYPAVAVDDNQDSEPVAEIPLSIALTQFHFLLLYRDRIMGISSLDDQLVYEEGLPLKPGERVIGTAFDTARHTCWVYTDGSIFELIIKEEERDVWKTHLQRGAYETALSYAKPGLQRQIVLASQGDRYFSDGKYIQSAQCYAQTLTRTFEEIVLKFVDVNERDALRYYLISRLERTRKSEETQRMMLATWLVEIYLSRINQLEDIAAAQAASEDIDNYMLEKSLLEDELKQFLVTYKDDLDHRTMFRLISQHGRSDILLHFADVVGENELIVRHYIAKENWLQATKALSRQSDPLLYYKHASVLMQNAPKETVDAWIRENRLQPRRLMPAILQHRPANAGQNEGTRYLLHVVHKLGNTDSAIHNLLISLLARDDADGLLRFIEESRDNPLLGQPCYDLDFALRTCLENGRKEACVRIYTKLGLYADAVDLALNDDEPDLESACQAAEQAEGDDLQRKKIWLKVAKYVVETKKDIKAAMAIIERSKLLSIEDVLPFFPDFVVIDDFKNEICSALETYATRIENMKAEMDEASQSAQAIREDIDKLSSRFVTVEPTEKCSICDERLFERQFYVFPCRHTFHADCLIAENTAHLPRRTIRRILYLQEQLSSMTDGLIPALPPSYASAVSEAQGAAINGGADSTVASRKGYGVGTGLDKLREIILPDAVVHAISQGVSVGVAGGRRVLAPLDPFADPTPGYTGSSVRIPTLGVTGAGAEATEGAAGQGAVPGLTIEDEEKIEALRDELDSLVASSCALCEGALSMLSRPFVSEKEKGRDEWAL